jgi:hypothetical protein
MSNDRHAADQARAIWPPTTGMFRLRLVRGAWAVPCLIARTDEGDWYAEVDGCTHHPHADPAYAEGVSDIWTYGEIIDQPTYTWLLAMKDHAAAHDPDHPCLHPRRAIDRHRLQPVSTEGHTTQWTPT